MAARFLFQRLSSRISSRKLLRVGSHLASASRVSAPVCRVSAVRHFNTLPWTCPAAKTSSTTNSMASVAAHRAKPAFVDSAGVKPTFSSNSPTKHTVTLEGKCTACGAETATKKSAFEYRHASEAEWEARINANFQAWKTKFQKNEADFRSLMKRLMFVWAFAGTAFVVESTRRSHGKEKSSEIAARQWQKLWNNCK